MNATVSRFKQGTYYVKVAGKIIHICFSAAEAETYADAWNEGYAAHVAEVTPRPLGELLADTL